MLVFLGIPLIGWIQILIGAAVTAFVLIKYLVRPKRKMTDGYLLKDVHIIIGDGNELFHQNVLIKGGFIEKISNTDIETNVAVIDCSGYTLMPGLIDSHIHIQGLNNRSDADSDKFLYGTVPEIFKERLLPYGVTTIKDLCAPRHFIYKLRKEIKNGKILGPELLIVGPNFTAPDGHPANTLGGDNPWIRKEMAIEVSSHEQVSEGIRELKKSGVDFLKFTYQGGEYWYFDKQLHINKIDKTLMQQIIREGKENGLLTTAHVFYKEDVRELLEAGIYGIEHGILDEELSPDDICEYVSETGIKNVTLTGGEPLLQKDIRSLVEKLLNKSDIRVEIETNGAVDIAPLANAFSKEKLSLTMDYKLPSSGCEEKMILSNMEALRKQDTVKFVSGSVKDLECAEKIIGKFHLTESCQVFISPVFGSIEPVEIVNFMTSKRMNDVRLQIQMHKVIWNPEERGV